MVCPRMGGGAGTPQDLDFQKHSLGSLDTKNSSLVENLVEMRQNLDSLRRPEGGEFDI